MSNQHFRLYICLINFLRWKNIEKHFKVSGCKQFILATFIFLSQSAKIVYLYVAKINWLQPLTLKNKWVNSINIIFSSLIHKTAPI